jgi:hypothetical protein
VEEILEYHITYPDGSTEPLPQAQDADRLADFRQS